MSEGEVILYTTEDGQDQIKLRTIGGTVWLTQAEMAYLFDTTPQNVTQHLRTISTQNELKEDATCKNLLQVADEGGRRVERVVRGYHLDAILAGRVPRETKEELTAERFAIFDAARRRSEAQAAELDADIDIEGLRMPAKGSPRTNEP